MILSDRKAYAAVEVWVKQW